MLKPNKNLVVLKPLESKSDVLMPTDYKDEPNTGVVEVVGESVSFVKKGDKVLYLPYVGTEYSGYIVVRESEVLAIIKED